MIGWFKRSGNDSQLHRDRYLSKGTSTVTIPKIVDRGVNISIPRRKGKDPPIVTCLKGGYVDNAMILLQGKNVNVNQTGTDGKSPLYIACDRKYYYLVDDLLKRGADVNQPAWNGNTPLHVACKGTTDNGLIALLLDYEANVHQLNSVGDTPLHYLCNNPKTELSTVELLLKKGGAQVNLTNLWGESPLYVLVKQSRVRYTILNLLLNEGADVNQGDLFGNTPFHVVATKCSDVVVFQLLLDHGANINQRNNAEWTALRMCLNPEVVSFLLQKGAVV